MSGYCSIICLIAILIMSLAVPCTGAFLRRVSSRSSFGAAPASESVEAAGVRASVVLAGRDFEDAQGLVAQRYDGQPGTVYLIRPDQHVAARWRRFDPHAVQGAMRRAHRVLDPSLPAVVVQRVRTSPNLVQCPSCMRILYF